MVFWWPAAETGTTWIPLQIIVQEGLSVEWTTRIASGIQAWNSITETTNVSFYVSANTDNLVTAKPVYTYKWYGLLYASEYSETSLQGFTITLNTQAFYNSRNWPDFPGLPTSVMAHELGHAIGLIDDPRNDGGMVTDTIMNSTYAVRHEIEQPTSFDIQSVRILYN
jgi:hypothetical protein